MKRERFIPLAPLALLFLLLNDLGITYAAMGRHKVAIESLKKAIAYRPAFPEAHSNLGSEYYQVPHSCKLSGSTLNTLIHSMAWCV